MSVNQQDVNNTLDVVVVGAGFTGVCAAIQLIKAGITNIRVIEKADSVGGVWHYNTYPGVACDVPSHFYCYSFEPNPNWSRVFSPGEEIQEYIEHCANKYGVSEHLSLNTKVECITFSESDRLWEVTLESGEMLRAHHVVSGQGSLHVPAYPEVPGADTFKGPTMHSCQWDHSVDFKDKHVAVIGSAASAIQLIPQIAKTAQQVDVYQRTPNYIAPRFDRPYTEKEKSRMKKWPVLARLRYLFYYLRAEFLGFPVVKSKKPTRMNLKMKAQLIEYIRAVIADGNLQNALIPEYELGCKRILLSDDFYPSLNRKNIEVLTSGIDKISEATITSKDGAVRDTDIIVYATGFDIEKHARSIDIRGVNGQSLADVWDIKPQAYLGMMISGFPNFYMPTGPNTGVGTTSQIYIIERQVEYIVRCILSMGRDKTLAPREQAQENYNMNLQLELADTVWAGSCKSWYKQEDGTISTLFPRNARAFKRERSKINKRDFLIETHA